MSKFKDYIIIILLVICICCSVAAATKTGVIQGEQGEQGIQGIQGEVGPQGETGAKGDKGDTGLQGPQGIQGLQGEVGPQGEQGIQGEKGETGAQGPQGLKGEQGLKGDKGDTGAQGLQGIQGVKGDKGQDGLTPYIGENGNWFIGSVDTGVLAQGTIITTDSYYAMVDFEKAFTISCNLPAMIEVNDYLNFSNCSLYEYGGTLYGNIKLEDTLNVTQVIYKVKTSGIGNLGFKLPSGSGVKGGTVYNSDAYYTVENIMTSGVQYRFSDDLQYVYLTYDSFVMTDIEGLEGVEVTLIGQELTLVTQ
jgi:hypothetical protein